MLDSLQVAIILNYMICIYEDETWGNFYPLIDLRAVFELRFGCRSFLEKFRRLYPREKFSLWVREEISDVIKERYPDCMVNQPVTPPALFFCASVVLNERVPIKGDEELFLVNNRTVGFRLNKPRFWEPGFLGKLQLGLKEKKIKAMAYLHLYELVVNNPIELNREIRQMAKGRDGVIRSKNVQVHRSAVISVANGPVLLDEGCVIGPLSYIEGPAYIGKRTVIDQATVRQGCSFGPECRIGGEVECSIFQGYSNKHHEGFIGHSYIGEWVNLGALTTCSDLKNNYQPVKIRLKEKEIYTGQVKLGCFIGDHCKTAIGSMIPTGAVLGTGANWYEPGVVPKSLPAFAWGKTERWKKELVVDFCRRVMARRGVEPSRCYEDLLLSLYERSLSNEPLRRR